MKIKKILLPLLLCIALLLAAPVAYAEEPGVYTDNYLQYTIENGSITIINYYGPDAEVTVPASIGAYPVNVIAEGAFASCENVTKINLPDCIMTVEQGAFAGTQTVVFDSNTDEPIAREPDVEREKQDQEAAQNPEQNEAQNPGQSEVQNPGQNEAQNPGQNQGQNPGTNEDPTAPSEREPAEAFVEFGEGEGDMIGVPINPSDGTPISTNENAGASEPSQQGSAADPANQSNTEKSGMPWYGIAAIVIGVAALAGGGYALWRKKHGTN